MPDNLRNLLIQRAARLQERPALTSPAWGTLDYSRLRNRVEGVALGLLASECPVGMAIFSATGTPWDWAAEIAAACCGLRWESPGAIVSPEILGGIRFNDERGRGPYHEREHEVAGSTCFSGEHDHAAMMQVLRRMNRVLGWDHETVVRFPVAQIGTREVRAALWCVLYAGSHAILDEVPPPRKGMFRSRDVNPTAFDPAPFLEFWTLPWAPPE